MQESNFLDKNIWLSLILFPFANIMLFILCFDDSILGNDIIFLDGSVLFICWWQFQKNCFLEG